MIKSGRQKHEIPKRDNISVTLRSTRLVAILGILVFTIFLCSAVDKNASDTQTSTDFGEGTYPVFAPVYNTVNSESEDTAVMEDSSIWAYLESVIARLIYGDP